MHLKEDHEPHTQPNFILVFIINLSSTKISLYSYFIMTTEKFTLTWHSYASHFQDILGHLFDSGDLSDVTLVCDDQVKFKAHKFVLKACSPKSEKSCR